MMIRRLGSNRWRKIYDAVAEKKLVFFIVIVELKDVQLYSLVVLN